MPPDRTFRLFLTTLAALVLVGWPGRALAQTYWIMPRESQYAQAMQRVGVTDITIAYHRPMVKGRAIWGCETTDVIQKPGVTYSCLVPNGQVWRAGANDATTITFSTGVTIGGRELPAGTYGLFMIPGPAEWTIVFNKTARQWGAFSYDDKQDALRVKAASAPADMQEALLYDFHDVTDDSTEVELRWEKMRVAFRISADTATLTKAKTGGQFNSTAGWWAAGYWLEQAHNPEEALKWINASIAFGEDTNNLMMKSSVVAALKRYDEAIQTAERALALVAKMPNQAMAAQLRAGIEKKIADWKKQGGRSPRE